MSNKTAGSGLGYWPELRTCVMFFRGSASDVLLAGSLVKVDWLAESVRNGPADPPAGTPIADLGTYEFGHPLSINSNVIRTDTLDPLTTTPQTYLIALETIKANEKGTFAVEGLISALVTNGGNALSPGDFLRPTNSTNPGLTGTSVQETLFVAIAMESRTAAQMGGNVLTKVWFKGDDESFGHRNPI